MTIKAKQSKVKLGEGCSLYAHLHKHINQLIGKM